MNDDTTRLVEQARELTGNPGSSFRIPDEVFDLLAGLADAVEQLQRERDLAVDHDRQPYPTAEAYERVCAALERKRARVAALEAEQDHLRGWIEAMLADDCLWREGQGEVGFRTNVRLTLSGALDGFQSVEVSCDGRCVTPDDLGVTGTGVEVAYPDPECSLHGRVPSTGQETT